MPHQENRTWRSYWIAVPHTHIDWQQEKLPAPFFRKEFTVSGTGKKYRLFIAVAGFCECYLNGEKVDDRVLDPPPCVYDRHTGYVELDVTHLVRPGLNTIGLILGNGTYNCTVEEVWNFRHAVWRNFPRFMLELMEDGTLVLGSRDGWKVSMDGPIREDELRSGEVYDARREAAFGHWAENGFDDSSWLDAKIAPGPGGETFAWRQPPCRVHDQLPMHRIAPGLYDARQSMAGRALLHVRGPAGSQVIVRYGERLTPDGLHLDTLESASYHPKEKFQVEKYTLKGAPEGEKWHSRFTYHGFQYAETECLGGAEVLDLTAQEIHTDFERIGSLDTGHPLIRRLEECTVWTFRNNFVGIPTDDPHREKNGWTADAQLVAETGLWHFDLASSYREWIGTLRDCQRPNGQLPGIAPASGWGYNWGNGPFYDAALWVIPLNVFRFSGNDALMRESYDAFRRYLHFLATISPDGLISYGLGDWQHYQPARRVDDTFVTTAYYYDGLRVFAETARRYGKTDDAEEAEARARFVRAAFCRKYIHEDGIFAGDEKSAYGISVYTGICPEELRAGAAARLNELLIRDNCIADFGMAGAKDIPRVLADYGYADTAFRLFIQPEMPGWAHWILNGATTLHEDFPSRQSLNQIMYGTPSAWLFEYAAGIRLSDRHAGFSTVELAPVFPAELPSISVRHKSPHGRIDVSWKRQDSGAIRYEAEIPDGIPGILRLPGGAPENFTGRIVREIMPD